MSLTENKLKIDGVDIATEINAKVDSSKLAKVALSGSYNDLTDKPSNGTSGDYLPLSGGTLTGELTIQSDIVIAAKKSEDNKLQIYCPAGTDGLQAIQFISQGALPILGTISVSEDATYYKAITQLSAGSFSTSLQDSSIIAGIRLTCDEANITGKVETQQPSAEQGDNEIATLKWVKDNVAPVNADWNATSGLAQIKNKPTIPTKLSALTNDMGFAKIQSSTTDLTAGSSTLATGTVYLVYE